MITPASLILLFRGLILVTLFVILCFKILWFMMGIFINAPHRETGLVHYGIALDVITFILFLISFVYYEKSVVMPPFWNTIYKIPLVLWIIYCFFSGWYTMFIRFKLVKWRQTHVTEKTLHQALDNLPMGVCVYNADGILQLTNYQMQYLCHRYTKEPLLNGLKWEECISALPNLMLRFTDQEIWHFRINKKPGQSTVITASNVSEEMLLNQEIQLENIRLEGINQRMRRYGLELEEIIRQEELLRTQIRVHDDLGHILLTSRVFMNQAEFASSEDQLRKEWKQLLLSMKEFRDTSTDDSQLSDLIKAAKTLGIDILIEGTLPDDQTLRHLIASSARECLTNAAKANANMLWITINKSTSPYKATRVSFTNNGDLPAGPVHEGVGLGTLRQIVEREGARMIITTDKRFCLTIEM